MYQDEESNHELIIELMDIGETKECVFKSIYLTTHGRKIETFTELVISGFGGFITIRTQSEMRQLKQNGISRRAFNFFHERRIPKSLRVWTINPPLPEPPGKR